MGRKLHSTGPEGCRQAAETTPGAQPTADLRSRYSGPCSLPVRLLCGLPSPAVCQGVGQGHAAVCRGLPLPPPTFTLHRSLGAKMQIGSCRDLWRSKIRREGWGRGDISFI